VPEPLVTVSVYLTCVNSRPLVFKKEPI